MVKMNRSWPVWYQSFLGLVNISIYVHRLFLCENEEASKLSFTNSFEQHLLCQIFLCIRSILFTGQVLVVWSSEYILNGAVIRETDESWPIFSPIFLFILLSCICMLHWCDDCSAILMNTMNISHIRWLLLMSTWKEIKWSLYASHSIMRLISRASE